MLLLLQQICNLAFCTFLIATNKTSTSFSKLYKSVNMTIPEVSGLARRFFPGMLIGTMNLCNIICGITALRFINIPLFMTIRRTNPFFTLLL